MFLIDKVNKQQRRPEIPANLCLFSSKPEGGDAQQGNRWPDGKYMSTYRQVYDKIAWQETRISWDLFARITTIISKQIFQ